VKLRASHWLGRHVALLLACAVTAAQAQSVPPASVPSPPQATPAARPSAKPPSQPKNVKLPTSSERRRAARLYMEASALYQAQQFEKALDDYEKAVALDPTNADYGMAAQVARSHAVTALIQTAARDRTEGDPAAARAALVHALQLDPGNPVVAEHLQALAGPAAQPRMESNDGLKSPALGEPLQVAPTPGVHDFHLRANQRQVIEQVFTAYGIAASVDDSVRAALVHLDLDAANFTEATRALVLLTGTFYVPLDAHKVLVARDTRAMRTQFMRNAVETVYLSGMQPEDMTEMGNIARNVFEMQQVSVNPSAATLTLRGPDETLDAFNAIYRDLLEGRSQVLLDIRIIQLAHTSTLNTGVQPPQTITAFNVYAEEQAILNQNQALVQQIISSGLAAPGDTLAIIGILLASGQVSSSLFSGGLVFFGGGLTQSALSPGGPATVNLNLNSSDSRELDNYQLRLEDGEEGTLKSGTRYPIMTSTFSNGGSRLNIPGLNLPGTSGSLGSLLSSLQGAVPNIPQFQYQDLGLVLKARPRVLRSGDVAMTIDMKITALAGAAINNVPVLGNRSYVGAVTVPANQAVVLAAEIDKTESHAISGYPGLSEIPGLNNITDKNKQTNYSTLLIILTPHVIRSPHMAGHSPMLRVARNPLGR
jgi:type II secretory pathway component GspD/PulD (secretin)